MTKQLNIGTWEDTQTYLNNILNEVVNGFAVDYERQLGVTRARLVLLFEKLDRIRSELMFTPEDAALLVRAARLCDEELGVDEFHVRTGYTLEESHEIAARLERLAAGQVHAAAS